MELSKHVGAATCRCEESTDLNRRPQVDRVHLDPVRRTWAMRHAAELGVDEAAFAPPSA